MAPEATLGGRYVLRDEEERMPQGDRMLPGPGGGPTGPGCPP